MTDDEQTTKKTDQQKIVYYISSKDINCINDEDLKNQEHSNVGYSNNPDELDKMTHDQV